jgi:hypothetical protein
MNPYIKLPKVPIVQGRQSDILSRCVGKRVLHLGCVDAGLLRERFSRHELMHERLARVASELWGVDVDREGISFLQSKGIDRLIAGDVCDVATFSPLRGMAFDIILASEVVEHLENPGLFLDAVSALMTPKTELIITVPNAFRVDTLLQLLRGVEYVHPDHNYWFSYHTLTTLVRKKGYQISESYVYSFQPLRLFPTVRGKPQDALSFDGPNDDSPAVIKPPFSAIRRIGRYVLSLPKRLLVTVLYSRTPFWGDGLVIVAHRDEEQ